MVISDRRRERKTWQEWQKLARLLGERNVQLLYNMLNACAMDKLEKAHPFLPFDKLPMSCQEMYQGYSDELGISIRQVRWIPMAYFDHYAQLKMGFPRKRESDRQLKKTIAIFEGALRVG